MKPKRTLRPLVFGVIGALVLLAGSAAAQTKTTSCGICGNPNDAQDRSYCDPVTNQCVDQVAPCPPYFKDAQGKENLCEPNYGKDAQTGQCLYRAKNCFPPPGVSIKPATRPQGVANSLPTTPGLSLRVGETIIPAAHRLKAARQTAARTLSVILP